MEYEKKICPVCGTEFVIDKRLSDRQLGCTLECLEKVQARQDETVLNRDF